jgi:hypothetical protein
LIYMGVFAFRPSTNYSGPTDAPGKVKVGGPSENDVR